MIARGPRALSSSPDGKDPERLYMLPDEAAGRDVLARLGTVFSVDGEGGGASSRTYYDTFDRRLAAADALLLTTGGRGQRELRWETGAGRLVRRLDTDREPSFAADLPPGPFRRALEEVVDVRKLLPVARVRGHTEHIRVLGKGGKTTVRLALETWSIQRKGRRGATALSLVRLSPVRGYAKQRRALVAWIEGELGLASLGGSAFAELLGLGRGREAAAGAWPPPLRLGMRTDEAMRTIYRGLLDTMQANEKGTRARTDPEFLHEYRVALRRTRAGLARVRGALPQRDVERFKREFAWLGALTGPVRDIDVQILDLPAYERGLPEEARRHLAPLGPWLEEEGERRQARLIKALDSARYARLIRSWSSFLDRSPPARTTLPDAMRPVEEVARERIGKLHARVLKRGRSIDARTPAAAVHDLRLDAKKLRYLMEFFRRLFDEAEIKTQVAALKRLQDVLGRFNDFEVQQEALQAHAAAMVEAGRAPLESVLVMGRIVESLRLRQQEARAEIEGRFASFAEPAHLTSARRLFAPAKEPSA